MDPLTSTQFRTDFPEFANPTTFTDGQFNFWLGIGTILLRECVWQTLLTQGLELYIAHHLTIAAQNAKAVAAGGIPGQSAGVVASKAVDDVSVSYDNSMTLEQGAGYWNLTTYGTQFYRLMKLIGAGGAQVNGCSTPPYPYFPIWTPQ